MAGKGSRLHGSVATCVSTLQQECSPEEYTAALRTILRILKNIQQHPGEGSYKQIKKTNKAFSEKVWMLNGGQQIMYSVGWTDLDDTVVLFDSHKVTAAITLIEARLRTTPGRSTRSSATKSGQSTKSGQVSRTGWTHMAAGNSKGWSGGSNTHSGVSHPQSGGSNGWSGGSNGWSGSGGYGGCVCGQCGYDDDDDDSDDDDNSDDDDSWECHCGQCGSGAGGQRSVCGQCGENGCGSWTSTYQAQKTKTTVTRKPATRAGATGSSYGGGRSYGGGSYSSGGYGSGGYGGSYGGSSYGGGASCGTGGG